MDSGDLVSWMMRRAADKFGGPRCDMFNAAGFSVTWKEISGLKNLLDGRAVQAMMHGRRDVEVLKGGCHYRILSA